MSHAHHSPRGTADVLAPSATGISIFVWVSICLHTGPCSRYGCGLLSGCMLARHALDCSKPCGGGGADLECCIHVICHLAARVPDAPAAAESVAQALSAKVRHCEVRHPRHFGSLRTEDALS